MPATTYRATIDGLTFTRTSERRYTHCVVCKWADVPDDTYGVFGFCGSEALAQKLAQQLRAKRSPTGYTHSRMGRLRWQRDGALIYRDVAVLPVETA